MNKCWLIRTTKNQILGPISINKVRELLDKGSLKAEDEISSGNGYWFFIRENELVEKYIINEIPQGFNPVTEAESVLTAKTSIEQNISMPDEEDLEYPDDITQINTKEDLLAQLKEEAQQEVDLTSNNLSNSLFENDSNEIKIAQIQGDHIIQEEKTPEMINDQTEVKKVHFKKNRREVNKKKSNIKSSLLSQNLLFILVGLLFVLALVGFYFRKRLVREFIEVSHSISIVPRVYAQVVPDSLKKKSII